MSPSPDTSAPSAAILRRMRRMILPERVFGRPVGAQWNVSGDAKAATSARAASAPGQLVAGLALGVLRQRDEGVERRALDVVRDAHERGLGDLRAL